MPGLERFDLFLEFSSGPASQGLNIILPIVGQSQRGQKSAGKAEGEIDSRNPRAFLIQEFFKLVEIRKGVNLLEGQSSFFEFTFRNGNGFGTAGGAGKIDSEYFHKAR